MKHIKKYLLLFFILTFYLQLITAQYSISGESGVCPYAVEQYSINDNYCCLLNSTPDDYSWSISGGMGTITSGQGSSTITVAWGDNTGEATLQVELDCSGCSPSSVTYTKNILIRIPIITLSIPSSGEVSFECGETGSSGNSEEAAFIVSDNTTINVSAPSGWTYEEGTKTSLSGNLSLQYYHLWPTEEYTSDGSFSFSVTNCDYVGGEMEEEIIARRSFPSKTFNNSSLPPYVGSDDYIVVSNSIVTTGNSISLVARQYIELNGEFTVESGANFVAANGEPNCSITTSSLKSVKANVNERIDSNSVYNESETVSTSSFLYHDEKLSVYPNPTTGRILIKNNLELNKEGEVKVEIFDVYGKLIHNGIIVSSEYSCDLSHQPTGIYVIKITTTTNNESRNYKILKN